MLIGQDISSNIWIRLTLTMHLYLECKSSPLIVSYGAAQLTLYRKEDLGMYGNQLNYIQACWTVGYVIGEIPSNMLLTRVRPRYWIPAMEVCIAIVIEWAMLT